MYSLVSCVEGGWTPLSAEGRFMGASAWGDMERTTNAYYPILRQAITLQENGEDFVTTLRVHLLIESCHNWLRIGNAIGFSKVNAEFLSTNSGFYRYTHPYRGELQKVMGASIAIETLWNPDNVVDPDRVEHAEITQQRLDKAAALQLVFEDSLFHMIGVLLRKYKVPRMVFVGGTALNCIATKKVLQACDAKFCQRHGVQLGGAQTCTIDGKEHNVGLQLWIPPACSDTGVPLGAALTAAMQITGKSIRIILQSHSCLKQL